MRVLLKVHEKLGNYPDSPSFFVPMDADPQYLKLPKCTPFAGSSTCILKYFLSLVDNEATMALLHHLIYSLQQCLQSLEHHLYWPFQTH